MQKHPEAKGLLILALSIVVLLSLISFSSGHIAHNWLGRFGHVIAFSLTYVFGLGAFLLTFFSMWIGWRLLCSESVPALRTKAIYFSVFLFSACMLLTLMADFGPVKNPIFQSHVYSESVTFRNPYPIVHTRFNLGGVPCYFLYRDAKIFSLKHLLSPAGCALTFSLIGFVSLILLFEARLMNLLRGIKKAARESIRFFRTLILGIQKHPFGKEKRPVTTQDLDIPLSTPIQESHPSVEIYKAEAETPLKQTRIKKEKVIYARKSNSTYVPPPLTLLTNAKKVDKPSLKRELRRQAEILEETLASFGIEAKVGQVNCGPTITSFEVHPAIGVKVQKIKALENDIALNMQAKSIRIIAPIPGKAAVGVEVPSLYPQEVGLKEMLSRYQKQARKFQIPILLGKTVTGEDVMCDLTKMPHCIIAGATGSGKSVCINTIVLSILMNKTPDDLRLLLVDPKKVELSAYSELPHMVAPIITEPHGAYAALSWLVKEMHERYEIFKQLGVRNITSFNSRKANQKREEELEIEVPEKMPYMVAIIDEFADLMMTSQTDLETPIARIAQMARAVGIHLILATQRPSREVITGLIKANFPTRVAFKVSSRINSQIILDENGAETLLGNGDLLFMPPGSSSLIRAQGAFVCDDDIHRIISHCTMQQHTEYLIPSFDAMSREDPLFNLGDSSGKDDLYQQALEIITATKNASTTFLQRKLKIGYARAASLMDEFEANGIVGPQEGSRPRKVLL